MTDKQAEKLTYKMSKLIQRYQPDHEELLVIVGTLAETVVDGQPDDRQFVLDMIDGRHDEAAAVLEQGA